ncbi:MAG: lipopolysaccharide biosynthesis protein, partial [Ignavibacteria bacterium]
MLDKIRNLSKQTLIYGTSTIFGRFLNFILVPFYTNVFLPSEYGIFSVIFACIAFLNIFYSIGLESGYFKFASTLEVGDKKQNFSIPFLTILINSAVLSAIIFLFAGDIATLSGFGTNYTEIIRYASLILFFDALVLVPFAYLRLNNKAKIFAAVKIINIVVNVALNFILIIEFKLGVPAVFIGNLIASVVTFILLFPIVYNNLSFSFNKKLFDELLKFSLPYVPAGLA